MFISTENKTNCSVCGFSFEQNKIGRRKDYCSKNCQEFNKYLSAMEDKFLRINTINAESKKAIRSKFWSLANLTNGK
jgi:endogenous inhibitor of DNA gyrase (YacG/DUF329 family)